MQWMQLDQNGDANSWPLGEFLAQDEVRAMMLDPACTKSLLHRRRPWAIHRGLRPCSDGLHVIERVQKRWLPQLTP